MAETTFHGLILINEVKRGAAEGSRCHSRAEKRSWNRFCYAGHIPSWMAHLLMPQQRVRGSRLPVPCFNHEATLPCRVQSGSRLPAFSAIVAAGVSTTLPLPSPVSQTGTVSAAPANQRLERRQS